MASIDYKPKISDIPSSAGVYRFYDKNGEVIYVGKAKNLRNRLSDYFQDLSKLSIKTRIMLSTGTRIDWTIVQNEIEALTLEYSWIKEYQPRFNIMYRDDKSYPYLAISMNEKFPRVTITRNSHKKGVKYFGPYSKVWAIRETCDNLAKVFKIRSCSNSVFKSAQIAKRACLLGDIGKCSAPCVGRISQEEYYNNAKELSKFMTGNVGNYINNLEKSMFQASENLQFEKAGRIRDEIISLKKVLEKNTVVFDSDADVDLFALACDDLQACIVLFHVRGGRIRGTKSWIGERIDDSFENDLLEMYILDTYSQYNENELSRLPSNSVDDVDHYAIDIIPKEILVSHELNSSTLSQYLSNIRGYNVDIRVPKRGDKAILMNTALKNANEILVREKLKRLNDLSSRSIVLKQLAQELGLKNPPLRIECYDCSHIQGTNHVASMVVFEDAMPKKKDYRSYNISLNSDGTSKDDTAALYEVLCRRFARLISEEKTLSTFDEKGVKILKRFSYKPDLLVIDGALPQVNIAKKVIEKFKLNIPVVGLAKRLEEIWFPNEDFPLILPRHSDVLYLLQFIRDESHRFAIGLHRKKRGKAMIDSALTAISGVGPKRAKKLLKEYKAISNIRNAKPEEVAKVAGVGIELANEIIQCLNAK